jgi:hypothetical protein
LYTILTLLLQVDVDISSNKVASRILKMVKNNSKDLSMDLSFGCVTY